MDRTSLVSFGGQLVVVGLDGKLRTLIENEQPLQGEVIVARNDAEPIGLNVQLVKDNGVQDVSDDVAKILGALEAGQDPTQLGDEFASAAGQSDGSSLQTSGTVDRIGAELLADTGFETIGLESLGFSQTQILSLNELYLNTLRGNETSPAVEPAAPVAGDDIVQTDEDSAIIIDVLANDEDADSENLFIESATVPEEQGTVEIEDGKLIFTPAEDFNGDADITYVVSDGELEDEASVTVTVNPLNDAPVANDDSAAIDEDTPVTIDVLPNDTDIDGDTLTIVNASVPAEQGTVEIVDGKLIFTPAENFNGEATISYTVSDGELEDSAQVSVTVNPINDAPVANDDNVVTDEDTPVTINVLPNDTDIDGDTLTIVNASVPADQGTVEIVDGKLVFTPADNFNGEATISYTVSDGELEDEAQVSVTVNPINDAPVANDDSAATDEDTPVTIDVLPNDTDIDGDTLTIVNASVPAEQGTVEIVDGKLVFTPAENFNGEATISYTVSDGALEDDAQVSVTVNPLNDAPVANDDNVVTDEDTPVTIDILPNDIDVDGDTLTIVNASVPVDQGTVEIVDGKLVFTPADNFNGEATISYTVSDGALEDSAEVSVTVNPINDAPVANNDSAATDEDTPVTVNVLPNDTDVDGDTLTIVNASVPADQGTVEIVDGKLVFTPADNFNGEATISYTVSDGALEDSAEVSVTVNPVNDAPVANDDSAVTDEDTPVTIDVLPNDTDVDGDTLSIVNASVPADQGTVEIVDGKLVFTPADDFNGEATISYTVSDGELEDSAEVSVTVNPVNDAPVANDDSAVTDEDTPVTIDVLTNDTDVDGDTLTIVNASVPADQGTVEIVDGKLVFTPAENFNGEATISYTVSDGALEDSAEVSVTVNPINDAPVANDDSAVTDEDTPVTIDVLTNDTDVDGDTLSIVNASVPAEQGMVEIVDGKLVFTPADNFNGEATISYTVSDGVLEDSAEVSVTVNPINDVPTVENTIADQSLEEDFTPYTIDLNDAFSDVDNADDELTFSVSGNSNIQVSIVDGIATITPTADWNGSEELTFTAEDPSGETVSQVVDFTVAAVADIVSDSADIVEDTPTKLDVLGNDNFEGDAPVVSVEAGHEPTNGTVVVNNDGTITYTPSQDYNGPDQFTYTVTSGGVTETTTVTLNVTPVNDKPVVENTIAGQSLEEDFTPYTIDLNDAFSDVDNADGELTFSVSGNSNIQVSIVDGIATITPTADWNGSEELTFIAEDPSGETVSQVVDFTVAAVADIVSDSADIVEDTPTKLDVLGNDNFEGDAPVVSVEAGHEPTNGTVVVNNDGTITYTPNQDYNGPDQFTYTVSSGGVTESTTVTLNVTPVNDKPLNEDFDHSANELITNVIFDTDDKPLDEGEDSDHISDLEDDLSGDELQIRITELPTSGTLYFKDEDGDLQEITSADGTLYDKDSIYYEADNVGFLLGIKDRPDTPDGAESTTDFYNWGLSADGGESHSRTEYLVNGASIDISSDSGVLAQYNQKVSHIGHGIADNDGQGIQPGETISIDLSENPVGSVNLGLDGLGGLFEHGSNNAALITVTYQDASGAEHTQVIEFLKPEGNSMLFQETSIGYGKDYGLPEGSVITQLDFSTKTSGNWELRYVEGFPPEDSFDYVAVDSGNAESDPATVTITNEVLDGNVSEDGPSLTLTGNSVVEGEDITFSVALDEVTETTVKYPIDMLAQGSSADNADVNLSNVSFTNGVTFAGGFLIVPAGVSAFEVIVPSIDDLALENAEDMVLEIGGESGVATIQDNDSTTLSVSQVGDVNEGSDAVFTVSLSNEFQNPFVVNLKPTTDGSYTAEDADLGQMVVTYIDSQGKNQTLNVTPDGDVTIPAGITSITVTIPTKTDGVYENTESFGLTVTDNGGVTSNGAATGDANIIDAESAPTVSIVADQASVTEGGDANFTVSIDQKSDEDVVVSFTIGGDVDDKDYQAPTIYTVTIPAGQTSVALDVTTLDDGIYEGAENLTITLTDTTGADSTLDADTKEATVSITDAQSAPEVSISADQNSVNEGQTAGFTVTLDQVSDEIVTVKFEYTGVAEDGKDFTGIASIEIPAGQSSADLDIATLTDGTYEGAESFTVTIKDVDGGDAAIGANDNASVVINDAQQAPKVSIVADQASVTEGDDANFTVSIDQKSDEDVVVSFTIGGDVDDKDYQAPTIYTVTIPAGQTTVALDITTLGDGIYEGSENLTITLTNTSGADSTLDADTKEATVSITDAQSAPEVSISADQNSVSEGQTAGFTVTLSQVSDETVTVKFEYTGVAEDGKDFTGIASIEIPAGQSSADLDIATLTDGTYEGAESFTVTIKDVDGGDAAIGANDNASVVINDAQQAPKVSIVADQASVTEGGDANFTVSIDQKSDEDVVVSFTIGGDVDDKDYQAPTIYTVTIPAGQTSVALDVTTLDDGIYEGTENLTITLTDSTGADSTLDAGAKEATVSITDAQSAPEVSISADQNSVNEGQTAGFTVTLSQVSDETVTVKFEYTGVAEDGKDFTGIASIEIPAGQSSADLDIATLTDGTYEGAESFTVTIKDVDGADAAIGANDNASVVIHDAQQAPTVSIVADQASVTEGGDANFTVSIDQKSDEDVVVSFTIGGDVDDKDYQAPTIYTVTIPAGQTSVALDVTTLDDGIYEGAENLTITLTDTTGADSTLDAGAKEATVSITDAQSAPEVSISADQNNVNEGQTAGFTVTLDQVSDETVTVKFEYTGIAEDGKDFTGIASIEIPAGQSSADLDIATLTDGVYEGAESFTVTIKDVEGADASIGANDNASVIINDAQQAPTVSIVAEQASVAEGDDANFTVSIDQKSDEDVVVSFTIGGDVDDKDYQAPTIYTVTIPAGQTTVALDITTLGDGIYEGSENLTITLTNTSGADSTLDADTKEATVSITDAQSAPEVSISADQNSVNEGQTAGFTVTLSQVSDETVTVKFEYTGVAEDGKDFTGIASIEIPAGQSSADLDIATLTDGTYEGAESFTVTIKDVDGADAAIGANDNASVVIHDAQQAPTVSIVADQASVTEGGDANFTVSIDQKSDEDVVVSFTIGGDVDDKDYQAPTIYTVTIPAGQTSVALDVTTLDDGIYEGTENLTITLTDTTGADSTLDSDTKEATVSITDAQSAPEVSISADQNSVNEGQTAGFTVTLSQVSDEIVTVKFEYTGIAEDGKDFTGIASIEIPAGQSSADLDIATLTDGTYEGAESFTVTIKDVDGADASIGANDNASVIINDAQQAPTVSIVADQASVAEGGDASFTVSIDQKSDEDVVVSFTIGGDVDDKDYQAPTIYTVTIPAGQTSVALDVTTLDDGIYEGTENLTITLTDTTGADSTLDAGAKEATVSIIDAQKEVLSLQNVVGLEDQFIELGIVVNDGDTSVQTVELNGIPQGSIIEIDGQASIVGSVDAIVVSIDDISSVKVKAPEHSDVNFDIAVIARDDSDTIVETGSIYVDVHPDADKPILNIGGFEQVAAIDFEDVTIKSGSWDSDIEINKVEGAGTVGQWFTSNPGQHVEVGTEGTYLPGNSTNQVMEIEGEVGDKVLYTDMDLVAGRFYNFEFDIAARTNKAHTSDMSVTLIKVDDHGNPIDGSEVVLYDFDPTTHGWHKGESITLPVEESGKYRLLFEADEADSTGAIMDNIKFTAVDNLGYEDSFIKLSEIDASLQDSLDQSESLTVELTGIPVGSVLRDGEGDSANTYVVTQENKDDRIDVTDWDLSNLQVKTQDAGIFAITVIATSTERDTNKDDEHGDHIDVGGRLTAESTASINVEVIDKPTSGGDNNERPEPDYTAGEDMIDSVAYRSGFNDFNWQQSAAYVNAGNPEQNGLYDYDPSSGVSIDVGTGNDKVLMGGGDDIIYLGESHVQVQDGDISDDKFSSVLADFAATELNALTDTFGEQDQHLKIESQSKPGLDIGHGGAGDDVIFGEKGSDIVFGGTGHDTLDGGDGSDAVRGGSGNDVLIGGSGDDILIGDDGEDIFKFVDDGSGIRDGEVDTIKDFTQGEDKIDISDLLHTDDFDSIDSLLANNEIGLEADGDNLILTISESDGSSSQKVVIEGGSNQYSEFLSDGSLSPADGSAILNDLLKINNDIT
ncbi:tandem-95 repeat protein [Vibrio campbellii]|uniref:Ig-like domain-containing protein n=1 Tax=Vibrio campbellii TaxID=680 RepID=UPI001F07DD9D|nr:tandem-95 repeat protein [Vibrio campbellii]UMM04548.1 tandem-95 repeat protein [Vibrio campbellii]